MNIKKLITSTIASIMVFGFIMGCSDRSSESDKFAAASLSPEKIKELRKEYPLSTGSPKNVDLRDLTFKEVLDYTDSVIIAEVVQQMPDFSVDLITEPGTPEGDLAEKLKESGLQPYKPEFTSFQVNVDEVVTGEKVGSTINLIYNSEFKGVEPDLKPGMKIVVAIKNGVGEEQKGSYSFTRYGTYYVVEGDYVLSAFEGQSEEMRTFSRDANGNKLENLISEIKALKEN
ncbi:hypothetical protein [Paenibacillus sp. HW567]|uniref:hypothetical protein n=1 Tax=Paenibacillus sp. HW567 TaxID=1034769 RepID=UPI0003780CBF|nr:hypothetical protein [Paenibacillus sp. HW567]